MCVCHGTFNSFCSSRGNQFIGEVPDLGPEDGAIFTSARAVALAPEGRDRVAYCVGERGAQAALAAGWRVVHTAETADAAIERLDSGASFDLVLSDIVMPGTHSGLGLAEHLRSRHPDVAAVLMTGFADVGADEVAHLDLKVLRKPCPLPDLARALRDALARARAADTTGTGADPDTPR